MVQKKPATTSPKRDSVKKTTTKRAVAKRPSNTSTEAEDNPKPVKTDKLPQAVKPQQTAEAKTPAAKSKAAAAKEKAPAARAAKPKEPAAKDKAPTAKAAKPKAAATKDKAPESKAEKPKAAVAKEKAPATRAVKPAAKHEADKPASKPSTITPSKSQENPPGVLIAAAECAPLLKVGGMADVVGALPKYLKKCGIDARVIMPFHREVKERYAAEADHLADFQASLGWRSQFVGVDKLVLDGVTYYFIDNEFYFGGPVYCGGEFEGEQYAFFTRAVMDALPLLDFDVRVLHCNDWHTAMMPLLAKTQYHGGMQERLRTVLTIHNLHFQGQFSHEFDRDLLRVDDSLATPEFLEHYGCDNMLKAGIVFADKVTTVSPTYAREICEPWAGETLEGVLRSRGDDLVGILNGIDYDIWNPQTDKNLPANYSMEDARQKAAVRDALLEELGLEPAGENTAVIGLVSRLTPQKGVDLINFVIDELMGEDVRVIILGAGYSEYENALRAAENRHKGRLCSFIGYNGDLSHRIYGGSDLFLMPSLFEPCGISQLIAMRYGTLPIVRETGGLKDTVTPYNEFTGEGTGFSFANYDAGEMLNVIRWALSVWQDKNVRSHLMRQAMEADFSFDRCAASYADLYKALIA